jgi:hypothetical protein
VPPRPGYVSFIEGDMCSVALVSDFEAVVGRHILLYAADQTTVLKALTHHLRPDGNLVFQEFAFSLTETLMGNETTPSLFSQCDF